MNISTNGIALLRRLEGCSTVAYDDVAGLKTIGIGHLLTRSELMSGRILINGVRVRWADGLTGAQCDDLLRADLVQTESDVTRLVHVPLAQHQYDALVSFTFNVGGTAFRDSTLRKRVNAGMLSDVPTQLRRWVYAGGQVVIGLKNRREWEVKMWEGEYHA